MVSSYQGHLREPVREEPPRVEEFMARSFVTVQADMDIYQAMEVILKEKVSGAAVVDEKDRLVGFISEKDCLKLTTMDAYNSLPAGGPVSGYMTPKVITITAEMGMSQVAHIFLQHPYRKLPVVEGKRIVGMVRRRDLLEVIQTHYKSRLKYMRKI